MIPATVLIHLQREVRMVNRMRLCLIAGIVLACGWAQGAEPLVVQLLHPFTEFHAAAGGAALVFYEPQGQVIEIFETASGKRTGTIPIGDEKILFACDMDAVFVGVPKKRTLTRYDLKTGERVKSVIVPDDRKLQVMLAGNASTGPVYLYFGDEIQAVDPKSLAAIKFDGKMPRGPEFRVSADGGTLVSWEPHFSPANFSITEVKGKTVSTVGSRDSFSMNNRKFTPSADGSMVMYRLEFYGSEGTHLSSDLKDYRNTVPTADPRYFLAVGSANTKSSRASICSVKDRTVLATVNKLPFVGGDNGMNEHECGVVHNVEGDEPRLVLLPEQQVLAVVPQSNDRFVVEHVEFERAAVVAKVPATQSGPVEISLGRQFHEFHAADGGRLLVFNLKIQQTAQLVIYDTVTGKSTGSIELPSDKALFACDKDSAYVVLPEQKTIERFDLQTRRLMKKAQLSGGKPIDRIAVGCASKGPVWLLSDKHLYAFDANTLEPINAGNLPSSGWESGFDFRVSADGLTLISWDTYASPSDFKITRWSNGEAAAVGSGGGFSMANRRFTPIADGSLILYETKTFDRDGHELESSLKHWRNVIPSADPRFVIAVRQGENKHSEVGICAVTGWQILTILDDLPNLGTGDMDGGSAGIVNRAPDQGEPRLVYLPASNVLAVIPTTDDRFIIQHVSLDNEVASGDTGTGVAKPETPSAGADNWAIISRPPAQVTLSQLWSYQVELVPAGTKVSYQLQSEPPGMQVSPNGLVTWTPEKRPIGGKVSVNLMLTDAGGRQVPHTFDVEVVRPLPAVSGSGDIVKADDQRLELPTAAACCVAGLDGKSLLLCGDRLAVLGPDGFTVQKSLKLSKKYFAIAERKDYYVALCDEPRGVDIIDKTSLRVLRSRPLPFQKLENLALYPTRALSYIAYESGDDIPHHHFLIFDEATAEALTDENYIGEWLAISPDGQFLITGFKEIYEKGHRITADPDHIWIDPVFGTIDMMCRYDLSDTGVPDAVAFTDNVGGNGSGIRLSPDGKCVTYLSFTGFPSMSHDLASWNPLHLAKLPVSYLVKDIAGTTDLAYHPLLPLVACIGKQNVLFFNRDTGEKQEKRIADEDVGEAIERVYFSPDGLNLILLTNVNGVHYLLHVPLNLSSQEQATVKQGLPRKDKPMESNSPPPQHGPKKLPKAEA